MINKFISPVPLPTNYEKELLVIFMEECNEASHRASKVFRFGVTETQPGQNLSNKDRLSQEIGDLLGMIDVLHQNNFLNDEVVNEYVAKKQDALNKYMQTSSNE